MKIIFSNIWNLNPRLFWAVESLKQEDADVLIFAEMPDRKIDQVQELLGNYDYQQSVSPNPVGSLVVYSKYPISDYQEINEGVFEGRPQGIMRIEYGRGFKLAAIHTSAPWTFNRYKKRNSQLLALSHFPRIHEEPLIMAGDFNASHRQKELHALKACGRMSECRSGKRVKASWPMINGFWCIDHIYYSREFELKRFELLDFVFSDHLPVAAEFELN